MEEQCRRVFQSRKTRGSGLQRDVGRALRSMGLVLVEEVVCAFSAYSLDFVAFAPSSAPQSPPPRLGGGGGGGGGRPSMTQSSEDDDRSLASSAGVFLPMPVGEPAAGDDGSTSGGAEASASARAGDGQWVQGGMICPQAPWLAGKVRWLETAVSGGEGDYLGLPPVADSGVMGGGGGVMGGLECTYVIEVDGPSHFLQGCAHSTSAPPRAAFLHTSCTHTHVHRSEKLTGSTLLKNRQLEQLGYCLVKVSRLAQMLAVTCQPSVAASQCASPRPTPHVS